jgi:hypothetical protein
MREVWPLPEYISNTGPEWLFQALDKLTEQGRMMMLMTFWRIWHVRNEVIHDKKKLHRWRRQGGSYAVMWIHFLRSSITPRQTCEGEDVCGLLIRLKRIYNFLCSMLVFYTICLVFRYTSWYFYAFSGTNLLTRCHSASSLFSAIFVFQKSYTGNILGIGQNKSRTSQYLTKLR